VESVSIERFGESAPYQKLAEHFGITPAALSGKLKAWLA
jgi:transketolase